MHISFIIIYKSIDENVQQEITFWFFVTFGAVHVLKLVNLLPNKVMLVLLNMCLLIALILFP